jgi:uncharacterized membrane protein YphA (DoxX/SURF4 family)
MPAFTVQTVLQTVIGAGLLNVWLLRSQRTTAYRGGAATSLRQEFAAYGLPSALFYLVGGLKIIAGIVLLAGLWFHTPVTLATTVVAILMVGAIAMHVKVKDPLAKSVPAALMLLMCVGVLLPR